MTGDNDMRGTTLSDDDLFFDIEYYRKLVRSCIDMRRYPTALFWAEKVCVLNQNDPKDIYWLAQCMFLLGEYHRAANTIKIHGLAKSNIPCFYLLVESLYEAKEYSEAIDLLSSTDFEDFTSSSVISQHQSCEADNRDIWLGEQNKNDLLASILYLKGKVFEAMENRNYAMDCYVQALQKSVYCTEALDALVEHEMLMAWEEKELMQNLPFSQQCTEAESKLIKRLYESKLKKYYDSISPTTATNLEQTPIGNINTLASIKELKEKMRKPRSSEVKNNKSSVKLGTPMQTEILSPANKILQDLKNSPYYSLHNSLNKGSTAFSEFQQNNRSSDGGVFRNRTAGDNSTMINLSICLSRIQNSADLLAAEAEKLFYDCEYRKCIKTLDDLLKKDPFHNRALTVQIGCLVELKDFNKLFYVAHKLVDMYPDKAISWYAVGCYYDLIGKSDPARRYLSKATSLDRLYGPAWIAYGHSFAKENEHDQAMAAYFKATQLMRGCHLPLLYIGVECGLTKNLELAEKFFSQAMSIAPLDVFVLHELGVIKFEYENYKSAEEVFRTTAEIIRNRSKQNKEAISPRWEPLFNNLGHCCRKNKKYNEALQYHKLALLLKPQNSETYTAIGFVHALMGNLEEAIEYFHKSLSLNPDCVVTSTILKTCIEDLMEEDSVIDNVCSTNENNSLPKSPTKRPNPVEESPMKLNCIKLKFDDYEESDVNSDTPDNNSCDMSMDIV